MKKPCLLLLTILLLSGCTSPDLKSSKNLPTPTQQLCLELKRNIIFNTTSGPTFGTASATQKAEMYRLYNKYNCSKLEKSL